MHNSKEYKGEKRKPFSVITETKEENNRTGKARDLFKKMRDTKGIFLVNMGTIQNKNSMDLTEAEEIKTRWQEYTEELYKRDLKTQITTVV